MPCPKMPDELISNTRSGYGGGHLTSARTWTNDEVKWMQDRLAEGFSRVEVAEAMGRSEVSISIKLKRLKKTDNSYNEKHLDDKYACNDEFIKLIKPKSLLDVYAGNKFYSRYDISEYRTNDIDTEKDVDRHDDALVCVCKHYIAGRKYDIIDLDPFGSAYDCFDLAIKMAKKGIIITFGEYGHKRWKRTDFVRRYYGINDYEDICAERFIDEVQKIGIRNKKSLTPVIVRTWENICRVWFTISPLSITDQWNHHGEMSALNKK